MSEFSFFVKNYFPWFFRKFKSHVFSYSELLEIVTAIGQQLRQKQYLGFDVRVDNPVKEISTVYSLSLVGWLNLFSLSGNQEYLRNANECIEKILASQHKSGCWLFPYKFRNNPPDFPYACENFMTVRPLIFFARLSGR